MHSEKLLGTKSWLNNRFLIYNNQCDRVRQRLFHAWPIVILLLSWFLLAAGCQGNVEQMPDTSVAVQKHESPSPTPLERQESLTPQPSPVPRLESMASVVPHSEQPSITPSMKSPTPEVMQQRISTPATDSVQPSTELLTRGASLYQEYCAQCHGVKGDGKGELAADLNPRPADLVAGVYKFRSTPSGALPTDEDLFRTLSAGVPGTAMSDYQDVTVLDRQALVSYLKNVSPRFVKESPVLPIPFPKGRAATDQALARGQQVFSDMHCAACHGEGGLGNGELAKELSDPQGVPILPANLAKQPLKSGRGPKAIYRSVMTGLDGTPMPSYGDSLDPEEGWDLALYVFSLSESRGKP